MSPELALERTLASALRAADPCAAITRAAKDRGLPLATRRLLRSIDADGARIAALLVARLRFERLIRGSPAAEEWFDRDPATFAASFRRYHEGVAPTAFSPGGEAKLWDAWCHAAARADSSRRRRRRRRGGGAP